MRKNMFKTIMFIVFASFLVEAQVVLESETKITDDAMYFTGVQNQSSTRQLETEPYDYAYGRALTPHGDCIKSYKGYVFMTWYRGGKLDRHVMLTRLNTETGVMKTIEFPHQHTGFKGKWWIGETHNTIAIGISPINGTIHLVYDMHGYSNSGVFSNDYFRYSYSVSGAAELPDEDFTLDKFVKDPLDDDYRHCTMDGVRDPAHYDRFTYPTFFLNDQGELFLTLRKGTSHDGAQAFIKYDASNSIWGRFKFFNALKAQEKGETHNWSIYGDIKYVDGKIRIGFQRRLNNGNDKYNAQNGVYYAYSDDPTNTTLWKNHKGEEITFPLVKAEEALVYEPGDHVETTARNQVHMASGFDWTVTDNGDVHMICRVIDRENGVTKNMHSYKPNGASEFIITSEFARAETIYTLGDYVYVIGLNSGRPFIDRAEGGTNLFTRVYEQTSGKQFRKGQVHIANGKLYYYLLENNPSDTDDTQPTYLQIINLDVPDGPKPFAVDLVTPTANQSFQEGDNVQLYAIASADTGEITKVDFLVNEVLLQDDTSKPYLLDWTPSAIGTYTIKAVAYKTGGASLTSNEVSIEVEEVDDSDLTDGTYVLQNVATEQFLTDAGASATATTMSISGEAQNTHWNFVQSGNYFNIDSDNFGILRFTGAGFSGGANLVVSTTKSPPASDNDKVWTLHYNEADDTFRFEAKENGRYMYHDENGNVVNIEAEATDDRSKWRAIATSQVLSVSDQASNKASIAVYPNPAEDEFSIKFQNSERMETIVIYNILGEVVFQNALKANHLDIDSSKFKAGVYLIKTVSNTNKNLYSKLIIK